MRICGINLRGLEMYRTIIIAATLSVFISSEKLTQIESAARADNKAAAPTITVTKLDINDTFSNKYVTSYFIEDATYLRLKTLQLGYAIPQNILNRIRVDRLRVYVQAQNLLTFTNYSGLDPDVSIAGDDLSMGVGSAGTPTPKQVIFGLNLGF